MAKTLDGPDIWKAMKVSYVYFNNNNIDKKNVDRDAGTMASK